MHRSCSTAPSEGPLDVQVRALVAVVGCSPRHRGRELRDRAEVRPIERGYSICAALLDLEDPSRVLRRTSRPLYIPWAPYELYGNEQFPVDVPAVFFPVGALVRNGKLALHAGTGDKYVELLSCSLDGLVAYLWEHSRSAIEGPGGGADGPATVFGRGEIAHLVVLALEPPSRSPCATTKWDPLI